MSDPAPTDADPASIARSLEMWQAAGIMPTRFTRLRVLDLACGCAVRSLALAQKSPGIQVTCLGRPDALPATKDLAQRMNVASQVTLRPDDLLTADLGVALYDACLLGRITGFLAERQNRDLFQRVETALMPGGLLVLDAASAGEAEESASSLPLSPQDGGETAHSFDTYGAWLKDAGFREVQQIGKTWLVANK